MSKPQPRRRLKPDDILYRKLEPLTWDPESGDVADEAFVDGYPSQSFYVGRVKPAEAVLDKFANMGGIRERFGRNDLTASDLYDLGFGIAAVRASDILGAGFRIDETKDGHDYKKDGHINIIDVKDRPEAVSAISKTLKREEIFKNKISGEIKKGPSRRP